MELIRQRCLLHTWQRRHRGRLQDAKNYLATVELIHENITQ